MTGARGALRRYPALGFLAAAGLLATLLPSSLRLPLAGPSSVAEVAPVPGDGQAAGDLSELGLGSSGGLGFGAGSGQGSGVTTTTTSPTDDRSGDGTRRVPRGKRCVGAPPRQTEDPLSPPCVAYFDGDNGGATAKGVTPDEVAVVIYLGSANPARIVDFADDDDPGATTGLGPLIRAYQRYFNERYQTYGRFVHFYGFYGTTSSSPDAIRAHIQSADEQLKPFALVPMTSSDIMRVGREAAAREILSVNFNGFDRADHQRAAPYLLSFAPDLQDQAAITASFLCRRLAGRVARHSGNLTDRARTRSFGLLWQDDVDAPEYAKLKDLTKDEARRLCGFEPAAEAFARTRNETQGDYTQNIAAMRSEDVTTLVLFSSTVGPFAWGNAAEAAKWYPEIVLPGGMDLIGADANAVARGYQPLVWSNAFGLTYDIRRGALDQQHWYQAAYEGCPDCQFASDFRSGRLYNALTLLFWGIQSAGPRLTPANVDRGLHAIRPRPSPSPDIPAAYFTPGNYSWIKDATGIWWNPAGSEPGGARPGCYHLVDAGARYRAGEWPEGDSGIKGVDQPDQPCQGPDR